jgi:pilus assembly protein CpaC
MIEATSRSKQGTSAGRRALLGWALVLGCLGAALGLPGRGLAQVPMQPNGKPPDKVPALPGPEIAPLPQPLPGFGPRAVRLPRLPGMAGPLGTTPRPSAKDIAEYNRFVKEFIDPGNTLDLVVGRPRLMFLKQEPKRIQIGDETVATYNLIRPTEITIFGRKVGTTVMNLWFTDPADKKGEKEVILSYLVRVIPDPEEAERLQRVYEKLADEINETFPDSYVKIRLVGDKLVVSGQARDIFEGTKILQIVRANAPPEDSPAKIPVDSINLTFRPGDPVAPGGFPGLESFLTVGGPNVVNLLRIPGEQQVMLKVTVAEINRQAARSIGLNFSITNNQGITVFQNNTGNVFSGGISSFGGGGLGGAGLGGTGLGGVGVNNLPAVLDNGQINLAISALKNLTYARSLAEPNLVAMNGQTATFLAGGQFPVPVVSGFTFAGLQGVQFIPFGVQLAFTPYITDKDRIRLNVSAVVSVREPGTGAQVSGSFVPGLNTRNFSTTVELREGQTLAVAGLIQNNLGAESQRIPFLGDIPFLGHLTGLTRSSAGEQELVVLITPELVHPMEPKQLTSLPGSDLFEPSDLEFYLLGRIESRRGYDYRSPVMTDVHRMFRYHKCEQLYLAGPSGHDEPH